MRRKKSNTNIANQSLSIGLYRADRTDEVSSHGATAITKIAPNIARTPKNLASMIPPVKKLTICTTQTSAVKARKIA